MNTMYLAVVMTASSLLMLFIHPAPTVKTPDPIDLNYPLIIDDTVKLNDPLSDTDTKPTDVAWNQSAVQWLLSAQSPDGGWGSGSHSYQEVKDPHAVQTDPATTSFAALALMKAGGKLETNPYKKEIVNALNRLLKDIDNRPDNGRITSLTGTQPQIKLGIHIDASMALQFLTAMRDEIKDPMLESKIDKAANTCISLIQKSQNADGGWAGGGWAPVLQSAMANNALEVAQGRYDVDEKAIENSRQYQANNIGSGTGSGSVRSEDAAGVPLYAAVSAQRATAAEAKEVQGILPVSALGAAPDGTVSDVKISKALQDKGVDRERADRMAKSYSVNQASTKTLESDDIWSGFGNNGGEEYLSYMMTSESLSHQDAAKWLQWRNSIEPKFKSTQNPNGSWSGQHCITSPVFCTAAVIQAWNQ